MEIAPFAETMGDELIHSSRANFVASSDIDAFLFSEGHAYRSFYARGYSAFLKAIGMLDGRLSGSLRRKVKGVHRIGNAFREIEAEFFLLAEKAKSCAGGMEFARISSDAFEAARCAKVLERLHGEMAKKGGRYVNVIMKREHRGFLELAGSGGCVNCDEQDVRKIVPMILNMSRKVTDRRFKVVECIEIRYPDLPCREDIIDDILLILERFGVPDQYAAYVIDGGSVLCMFCRLSRFDLEWPAAFSRDGKNYYLACCASAMQDLSEKYGYETPWMDDTCGNGMEHKPYL